MNVKNTAEIMKGIFGLTSRDWPGYGDPSEVDIEAAIYAMHEHLSNIEGAVAMELPNTSIKLDRDEDGVYNIFFRVGTLEVDSEL